MPEQTELSFLFRIPRLEEWTRYLELLQESGISAQLQEIALQHTSGTFTLPLSSLLSTLKQYCDQEEQLRKVDIGFFAREFFTDENVLFRAAELLDFGYRSVIRQIRIHAMTQEQLLKLCGLPDWQEEALQFVSGMLDGLKADDWAAIWEATIQMSNQIPDNPYLLSFAGEIALIRNDGFADPSYSNEYFSRVKEIHKRVPLRPEFIESFADLGLMANLILMDHEEAKEYVKIGLEANPKNSKWLFDFLRVLLTSGTEEDIRHAEQIVGTFLNEANDEFYYISLLAFAIDPLLRKIYQNEGWFTGGVEQCKQILSELDTLSSQLTQLYQATNTNPPEEFNSIINLLKWYRGTQSITKTLFALRALSAYRTVFQQLYSAQQLVLIQIKGKEANARIDILIQASRMALPVKIPETILYQARDLMGFETNAPDAILQWYNEVQSFISQQRATIDVCEAITQEWQGLTEQEKENEHQIRRIQPKTKLAVRYLFNQAFYTIIALVLWGYVIQAMGPGGFRGTSIFIGFFALVFTVLLNPFEAFRQYRSIFSIKEEIRVCNQTIATCNRRKTELMDSLQTALQASGVRR